MRQKAKIRAEIVSEYLVGGVTYRELERKYGYSAATICRWVNGSEKSKTSEQLEVSGEEESASEEVLRLRAELKKAKLHNELLNAMIDIAEEDLGVNIRKKRGPGR